MLRNKLKSNITEYLQGFKTQRELMEYLSEEFFHSIPPRDKKEYLKRTGLTDKSLKMLQELEKDF